MMAESLRSLLGILIELQDENVRLCSKLHAVRQVDTTWLVEALKRLRIILAEPMTTDTHESIVHQLDDIIILATRPGNLQHDVVVAELTAQRDELANVRDQLAEQCSAYECEIAEIGREREELQRENERLKHNQKLAELAELAATRQGPNVMRLVEALKETKDMLRLAYCDTKEKELTIHKIDDAITRLTQPSARYDAIAELMAQLDEASTVARDPLQSSIDAAIRADRVVRAAQEKAPPE
jgi:vacuolar-type H+-ATPase subunit I/STV1